MSEAVALEARGVARSFRIGQTTVNAVDGVSLSIAAGEMVALLGPSGSGKSSLLALLGGLDRPTAGDVWLHGRLFGDDRDRPSEYERGLMRRQHIGFVFQSYNLLSSLNTLENVMFPLLLAGMSRRKARIRALEALDKVGLSQRAIHLPAQTSGGEQQRVAIARAIVHHPSIILADEPTGNLDSQNGVIVASLLQSLCFSEGKTVVLVTHDRELADRADRIVYLKDGQIVGEERGVGRDTRPVAD